MLTGKPLGQAIGSAISKKIASGAISGKADIARHFEIKTPSIYDWIKKGSISKDKLPELWRYFSDVVGPEHWGLESWPAGKIDAGEINSASINEVYKIQESPAHYPTTLKREKNINIPQYNAAGGMGRARLLLDEQPGIIKSWDVDQEWLRLNVPCHTGTQNLCIVTGFGPSMRPMFNPGDPLLVDRGVTKVESDGVYFFRIADHGFIKLLQRVPVGNGIILRAKSKNPDYDTFDIHPDMDFQVIGKVLTAWKSEHF